MKDDAEREIQRHVKDAQRALKQAIDVCTRVARSKGARNTREGRRANVVQRRLVEALRALDGGVRLRAYEYDPDLVPESTKFPGWHKR